MQTRSSFAASTSILRYFWLFIVLLVMTIGLFSYNYTNAYITEKKYALTDIAAQFQKRIDSYRFATYQIYDNLVGQALPEGSTDVWENRLRPDAYYLEKSRKKTDAIIFGNHDSSSLDMALKVSNYLDTLWGPETNDYSFYYLNGQDNSLMMISTQSIKDLISRYKDSYLTASIDQRRTEMLQQANMLDERESFSPLRRFRQPNAYYFTLRTTFNQPGHLATVVAFDLPINDLIPKNMSRSNFLLLADSTPLSENATPPEVAGATIASFTPRWLEISAPLANAPLKIVYRVPLSTLALDLLHNNFWLAIINLLLLVLALLGIYFIRHRYIHPNESMQEQLNIQQQLNREIVSNLPLGLLIYDFAKDNVISSNHLAEQLLPHLSLQNIRQLAEQHHGLIQMTINNAVYEVRMIQSHLSQDVHLILLQDQDKDLLFDRKMQQIQREYEKNQQARKLMLHNLGNELNQPLTQIHQYAQQLQGEQTPQQPQLLAQLRLQSDAALHLIDNIQLLTRLETLEWQPGRQTFAPAELIDQLLLKHLPMLNEKGLLLFNHCSLQLTQHYIGDEKALGKILSLLLRYAIMTTDCGKITCQTTINPDIPEELTIVIMDTGRGLSPNEIDNLHYPFLSQTQGDRFYSGSGLTFFLCDQLCKKLNGKLSIQSRTDIGTRYNIQLQMGISEASLKEEEDDEYDKLLNDVVVLLDITADEIRDIVSNQLTAYGASCLSVERHKAGQGYDIHLTDDPNKVTDYSLLLAPDAIDSQVIQPRQLRVNYNLQGALLDAILTLIEQRLHDTPPDLLGMLPSGEELSRYSQQLQESDYFALFANTVPEDVKRLYTEARSRDFTSLSQTTHRLKGVFAMLDLLPGKQLCESLEQQIAEGDEFKIDHNISQIDFFVSRLQQQGSQQHE